MFENIPLTDFTIKQNREEFREALQHLQDKVAQSQPIVQPIIDGKEISTDSMTVSINPADPSQNLASVSYANTDIAHTALLAVRKGAKEWSHTSVSDRCAVLRKAAALMDQDRHRLSSIIVLEAGKPWKEADADVVEAIDFCNYYAAQMEALGTPQKTVDIMGEDNYYFYQPRGVAVVISPWNFPLAIACGMFVAALVSGNTAILKPAEQTSWVAYELIKILQQAGLPDSAFAFLPGIGEEIGPLLVESPLVDIICFTGSRAVGLSIVEKAAVVHPGQQNIKRVIAELGGKNAIIVDEDADLDEAVKGVLYSAFGFAGQKCSACSRVIAVGDSYEVLMSRLCQAAGDIIVDDPRNSAAFLGPVIDQEAQTRLLRAIEEGEKTGSLAFKGTAPSKGFFVPPTIFRDANPESTLWTKELFGPVIACMHADSFDEALTLALDSEYALTGGLFSRSPANIKKATEEFTVGNLYINRGCTGAIVKRQPFGGHRMSGMGAKAGGPDYLINFLTPRTVSENSVRRGMAPEFT